eukprot:5170972-Lingulodinium_polyedra.AAC.1
MKFGADRIPSFAERRGEHSIDVYGDTDDDRIGSLSRPSPSHPRLRSGNRLRRRVSLDLVNERRLLRVAS